MTGRMTLRRTYIALSVTVAFGLLIFLLLRPGTEGDTQTLVGGAFHALDCLKHGQWKSCPEVQPFAIYQYIPAVLLAAAGVGASAIMHVLAYVSWIVFLLCFYEFWRALRPRGESLMWAGFLVLASGFGLRYLNLSSGEMLAAYLTLGFVSSFTVSGSSSGPKPRSLAVCCLFAFAATITKETAAPFFLLWVFSVVFCVPESRRTLRDGIAMTLWIFAGVGVNLGFNWFRFGSLKNLQYMQPWELVTDPHTRLSYFFAEWFSPAGGLWIFWTSFCVLLAATFWIACRAKGWKQKEPGLAVLLILLGMTIGYSGWYAPLGGFSWGARFYVPWVPGVTLFVLWVYGREFQELFRRWTTRPALFWGVALLLEFSAFPQYAFLMRQSLIGHVLQPAACSGLSDAALNQCIFWQPWPWGILAFFRPLPRLDLFILAAFMSTWIPAMALRIKASNSLPPLARSDTH